MELVYLYLCDLLREPTLQLRGQSIHGKYVFEGGDKVENDTSHKYENHHNPEQQICKYLVFTF